MFDDPDFMDKQLGIDRSAIASRAKEKYKKADAQKKKIEDDDSFLFASSYSMVNNSEPIEHGEEWEDEESFEGESDEVEDETDEWDSFYEETQDEFEGDGIEFAVPQPIKHNKDFRIYPGGPYQSQINSWKKQFGEVYMLDINDERFVWRTINRYEYKEIVAITNTDPLMREEMICETCVLYPPEYDFERMANEKGGTPSALSEAIMEKSGFTRNYDIKRL